MNRCLTRSSLGPLGGFVFATTLTLLPGCGREPEEWQGPTMEDTNADVAVAEPEDDLGSPPAFNPGGPSTSSGDVDWTPSGVTDPSPSTTAQIDMEALRAGDPRPGGDFNRFFPPQSGGDDMVAKQEKEGFAQYSLRQSGDEIAQLSITDLRSYPGAADKFNSPDSMLAGFPVKADGSKGTTLLVGGRYQVKVRSPAGQLDEAGRKRVLEKFDLSGLSGLTD